MELYVAFWLNRSIHAQFEAFAKGFLMLCGGPALQLFSATELERLVCGNPFLDFEGLQRSARYEGGYSPGGCFFMQGTGGKAGEDACTCMWVGWWGGPFPPLFLSTLIQRNRCFCPCRTFFPGPLAQLALLGQSLGLALA